MEFIIRNHKISDLWLVLMTIFNNSCIFYYIFLMPCCGILLRHFALYINLSQRRWADFLPRADDGAKRALGLALPRAAITLSKHRAGCPAMVQLLPSAAPHIADPMLFPAQAALFQHPQPSFGAGRERNSTVGASLPSSRTFCLETRIYLGYCSSAFSSGEHSLPFWDH